MLGTEVSHYTIVGRLGRGGMGEVYAAEDRRLGRQVALKFLSPELAGDPVAIDRFKREARAASALNHPHICTVYDVGEHGGQHFIAMELLTGATLHDRIAAGALPLAEAVAFGIQLADALAAAHRLGVVHRDIKPANVFVTDRGTAKLLDFGLARPTQATPDADTRLDVLTAADTVVGTIGYMSPEQVRGDPLDARTDVFSLGVVLYEMVTGQRAFQGATAGVTYDAILNQAPPPASTVAPGLPSRLDDILGRALEKDRALRYQDADDLRSDLQRLARDLERGSAGDAPMHRPVARGRRPLPLAIIAAAAAVLALALTGAWLGTRSRGAAIDSVAVLPFVNATGRAESEYLSDGITEGLIRELSQLGTVKVVARSVAFRYKGAESDGQRIGRDLGVRAVLSGRLLEHANRIVVRAELMDVADGSQIWGGEHSSAMTNVFALQHQLTEDISSQLQQRLTREQRQLLAKAETASDEAYRSYLQGRYHYHKRSHEGALKAIDYLTRAVDADPAYALAWAGLADAYAFASFFNVFPPREVMPKAKAAAMKAIEADAALAEPHIALGYTSFTFDWDWKAATSHFERALALDRRAVEHHGSYAFYLTTAGRHDDAIRVARAASDADPISASASHTLAVQLVLAGRLEDGIAESRRTIELDPNFAIAYQVLAMALSAIGRYQDALSQAERSVALAPNPVAIATLAEIQARLGRRTDAEAALARLEAASRERYVPAMAPAMVCAGLGDRDRAFAWLERAYEERTNRLAYLRLEPVFRDLHGDPRFERLLVRIGLPR